MRKTTVFFSLLGIAVIIILIVLFSGVLTGGETGNTPFARVDKDAIDRIVVASGTFNHIVVEKRVAGWLMLEPVEYPADSFQIQAALALFTSLIKDRVVGSREALWNQYQVSDQALQVRMYARGSLEGGLIIGKDSPDGLGVFARIRGDEQIFLVKQPLRNVFTSADTAWRSRAILEFQVADVKAIERVVGKKKYRLTRVEEKQKDGATRPTWYLDGKLAKQDAAAEMADLLSRFTTNLFDDRGEKDQAYGFHVPQFVIGVEFKDGKSVKVEAGNQESGGGDYYIRRVGEKQVFLVHPQTIGRINKSRTDLL